jgi:hypothetical protein
MLTPNASGNSRVQRDAACRTPRGKRQAESPRPAMQTGVSFRAIMDSNLATKRTRRTTMVISITRVDERSYKSVAIRSDGVHIEIPGVGPSRPIPHDLLHYFVERELKLKRGFWGCVAAGGRFKGTRVAGGRSTFHAVGRKRRVIRPAKQEISEAEIFAALVLRVLREEIADNWQAVQILFSGAWHPARPTRGPITRDELSRICTAVREAEEEWQKLPVSHSLTVCWNVA